jgi:hypothetical protein
VEEALDGLEHGVDGRALAGGAEEGEERREGEQRAGTHPGPVAETLAREHDERQFGLFSAALAPVIDASAT